MRELELVGGCHFSGVGLLGFVSFVLTCIPIYTQGCHHGKQFYFFFIKFCIVGDLIFSRMTSSPVRLFSGYQI